MDYDSTESIQLNQLLNSTYSTYVYGTVHVRASRKVWGSVTWKVNKGVRFPTEPIEQFNLAVKALFDLEAVDAETVWGLIPWSWLVDYFVDIGGLLKATNHSVEVSPHDICIMRRFETKVTETPTSLPAYATCTNGLFTREWQARDVWVPGSYPAPRLALLSASQLKVLLALALRFG